MSEIEATIDVEARRSLAIMATAAIIASLGHLLIALANTLEGISKLA